MNPPQHSCFGYRICATEDGWTWVAFDTTGEIQDRGVAPSKAVAAACVIRALARSAIAPDSALRTAA